MIPPGDDPWLMTVILRAPADSIDADEVRRALSILVRPGACHELRGLPSGRSRLVCGGEIGAAVEAARSIGDDRGVYYTLNPVRPDLGNKAARVGDIMARHWLLIDCDRDKAIEPDAMATDGEKRATMRLATEVLGWLSGQGWPLPVLVDSGNGQHLLYSIDLPASDHARQLIGRFLKALAARFNRPGEPGVDTKVHNANRISKLPGTWVRKGANVAERPWRMARLIFAPDPLVAVATAQIEAVAGMPANPPGAADPGAALPDDPWEMVVRAEPDKVAAYTRSAVEREIARVVLAPVGDRNNALNRAAFAIGQFVGAGVVDRADVVRQLLDAARRNGLGDYESARTIESGIEGGTSQPRTIPESARNGAGRNGAGPPPNGNGQVPAGIRLIVWAKDIAPRKVEWLWPNRIPVGKMTTFAGQTGMGKTFTVCDIAARVSRGEEIPCGKGECFEQGKVLIISAEDDADDTLVPRLIELDADLSRVAFLSPEAEGNFTLAALDLLNRSLDQMGDDIRMVAIDPPTSFLSGVDDHKNAELRAVLHPLRAWAIKRKVALIMVTHINKATGPNVDAMARVMGSAAWVQAVRAAHMFCADPDTRGRSLFVPLKVNNARKPRGIAYQIQPTEGDGAIIDWIGEVDTSADEALSNTPKKSRGVCATEWLADRFRERREWPSDELKRLANEAGISKNALWSPEVNALPLKKTRRANAAGDVNWFWAADEGWPHDLVGKAGKLGI